MYPGECAQSTMCGRRNEGLHPREDAVVFVQTDAYFVGLQPSDVDREHGGAPRRFLWSVDRDTGDGRQLRLSLARSLSSAARTAATPPRAPTAPMPAVRPATPAPLGVPASNRSGNMSGCSSNSERLQPVPPRTSGRRFAGSPLVPIPVRRCRGPWSPLCPVKARRSMPVALTLMGNTRPSGRHPRWSRPWPRRAAPANCAIGCKVPLTLLAYGKQAAFAPSATPPRTSPQINVSLMVAGNHYHLDPCAPTHGGGASWSCVPYRW